LGLGRACLYMSLPVQAELVPVRTVWQPI
jgi:hypothetical protein